MRAMRPVRISILSLIVAAVLSAAETPAALLLVLNKDDNALALVDPENGTVIARVPTGEAPHEVTVSEAGKFAYVGNYGSLNPGNTLSVIDLVARKELRRVQLGALRRPHGIVFVGGEIYFTAELNRQIARYDPASNRIDWIFDTGQETTHMLVVSHDRNTIFTSNIGSDTIGAIYRSSGNAAWIKTSIPVGKEPEGLDLSPDGKEVWSAHSGDGGVSIIDVAAKKVVQTLSLKTKRSNRLKFTPDGKLVLISDMEAGDLVVVDRMARKEIKRMRVGRSPEGIVIAPEGSRAYIAITGDNSVAVIDLKTLAVTKRINTGSGPDGMAWAVRR
jgi:YVTN family beta-propeller protein